eukprot:3839406-Prymnesium_polylepis.1
MQVTRAAARHPDAAAPAPLRAPRPRRSLPQRHGKPVRTSRKARGVDPVSWHVDVEVQHSDRAGWRRDVQLLRHVVRAQQPRAKETEPHSLHGTQLQARDQAVSPRLRRQRLQENHIMRVQTHEHRPNRARRSSYARRAVCSARARHGSHVAQTVPWGSHRLFDGQEGAQRTGQHAGRHLEK